MHNLKGAVRRDLAIDEAVRVLRPGGRLMVADLCGVRGYRRRLLEIGMTNVTRRGLRWRMCFGGVLTSLVTATKPRGTDSLSAQASNE
jgi:arsenite methyltransferase